MIVTAKAFCVSELSELARSGAAMSGIALKSPLSLFVGLSIQMTVPRMSLRSLE